MDRYIECGAWTAFSVLVYQLIVWWLESKRTDHDLTAE